MTRSSFYKRAALTVLAVVVMSIIAPIAKVTIGGVGGTLASGAVGVVIGLLVTPLWVEPIDDAINALSRWIDR